MERLKINSKYDFSWVRFGKFESHKIFMGYAYNVSNESIKMCLDLLDNQEIDLLVTCEIFKDWQEATSLQDSYIVNNDIKHSLRCAKLVQLIPKNGIIPVSIDNLSTSCSCLEGHHRLLALKYMGYKSFPCYLSGDTKFIRQLST